MLTARLALRRVAALLACFAVAGMLASANALRTEPRRADLSQPAGPHHRAVPRRRADRHPRPRGRAAAERGLGPGGGDREPARRQHRDRGRARRQDAARRLHAARGDGRDHGAQPRHQQDAVLRSAQGFRADHARVQEHLAAQRARRGRPEDGEGADRARQGQSGQAQLRRRHHHHALGRLSVQSRGRHRRAVHSRSRAARRPCRAC